MIITLFKTIGVIRTVQIILILCLLISVIIPIFVIIFIYENYTESMFNAISVLLFGLIIIIEGIETFRKESLLIPSPQGIGDVPAVNLKGHKKAKYFFSVLIILIGLIAVYISSLMFTLI